MNFSYITTMIDTFMTFKFKRAKSIKFMYLMTFDPYQEKPL